LQDLQDLQDLQGQDDMLELRLSTLCDFCSLNKVVEPVETLSLSEHETKLKQIRKKCHV